MLDKLSKKPGNAKSLQSVQTQQLHWPDTQRYKLHPQLGLLLFDMIVKFYLNLPEWPAQSGHDRALHTQTLPLAFSPSDRRSHQEPHHMKTVLPYKKCLQILKVSSNLISIAGVPYVGQTCCSIVGIVSCWVEVFRLQPQITWKYFKKWEWNLVQECGMCYNCSKPLIAQTSCKLQKRTYFNSQVNRALYEFVNLFTRYI